MAGANTVTRRHPKRILYQKSQTQQALSGPALTSTTKPIAVRPTAPLRTARDRPDERASAACCLCRSARAKGNVDDARMRACVTHGTRDAREARRDRPLPPLPSPHLACAIERASERATTAAAALARSIGRAGCGDGDGGNIRSRRASRASRALRASSPRVDRAIILSLCPARTHAHAAAVAALARSLDRARDVEVAMTGAVGHHHATHVTRMSSSRVAHVITVSLLPPPRDRPINRPTDYVAPRRAAPRRAAPQASERDARRCPSAVVPGDVKWAGLKRLVYSSSGTSPWPLKSKKTHMDGTYEVKHPANAAGSALKRAARR